MTVASICGGVSDFFGKSSYGSSRTVIDDQLSGELNKNDGHSQYKDELMHISETFHVTRSHWGYGASGRGKRLHDLLELVRNENLDFYLQASQPRQNDGRVRPRMNC